VIGTKDVNGGVDEDYQVALRSLRVAPL